MESGLLVEVLARIDSDATSPVESCFLLVGCSVVKEQVLLEDIFDSFDQRCLLKCSLVTIENIFSIKTALIRFDAIWIPK